VLAARRAVATRAARGARRCAGSSGVALPARRERQRGRARQARSARRASLHAETSAAERAATATLPGTIFAPVQSDVPLKREDVRPPSPRETAATFQAEKEQRKSPAFQNAMVIRAGGRQQQLWREGAKMSARGRHERYEKKHAAAAPEWSVRGERTARR